MIKISDNIQIIRKILERITATEDKSKQIKILQQFSNKYKDNQDVFDFCQFDIKCIRER